MHELAICESVLQQVLAVASSRNLPHVARITLRIGPLAGVEPDLVRLAFPIVAAGTTCADASLEIEIAPVEVRCRLCDAKSGVPPNRLLCATCGTWRVKVVSGDEMLLSSVELTDAPSTNQARFSDV
jgi:hydrogenase nickel incorporation protein HypA/HybF